MRKAIILIFLVIISASVFAQDLTSFERKDLKTIENRLDTIEKELIPLKVGRGFFSSILTTQTGIFSIIVVVLIAISWVLSYVRAKTIVHTELVKIEDSLKQWKEKLKDNIDKNIAREREITRGQITYLHADLYRAFANVHKSKPEVAYIWWLRAASEFHKIGSSKGVRICLEEAHSALGNLHNKYQISNEMDEIESLMSSIDAVKYRLPLDLINEDITRIYKEKKK